MPNQVPIQLHDLLYAFNVRIFEAQTKKIPSIKSVLSYVQSLFSIFYNLQSAIVFIHSTLILLIMIESKES